jgi:hypothetical protein
MKLITFVLIKRPNTSMMYERRVTLHQRWAAEDPEQDRTD